MTQDQETLHKTTDALVYELEMLQYAFARAKGMDQKARVARTEDEKRSCLMDKNCFVESCAAHCRNLTEFFLRTNTTMMRRMRSTGARDDNVFVERQVNSCLIAPGRNG